MLALFLFYFEGFAAIDTIFYMIDFLCVKYEANQPIQLEPIYTNLQFKLIAFYRRRTIICFKDFLVTHPGKETNAQTINKRLAGRGLNV